MKMLTVLVMVQFAVVAIGVSGGLAYLAYRHPKAREPLVIGLATLATLVALVSPIVSR